MSETSGNGVPDGIGLSAFEDTYDIHGELRGADDLRFFLARRRTSGVDAMITVVPAGVASENNALALFAADINLLSGVSHAGILQTIEGRWIDGGAFASVTERPRGVTVGELLTTGEQLDTPRIATLLREINGSLEWARGLGVVHRGVNVDAMFLEPGTNRLEFLLLPTPIAASGVPGAATDARTIGELAWTLLTGLDPESDPRGASLASLRPDLPQDVVTQVEAMREATRDAMPDIGRFIALVASADALKQAEADIEARRSKVSDEERERQEKLETESERWRKRAIAAEELLAAQRARVAAAPFVPTRPSVRVPMTRTRSNAVRAKQIAIPLVVIGAIAVGAFALAHRQSQPTRVSEALPVDTTSLRSAAGAVSPGMTVPPASATPVPSYMAPANVPPASVPPSSYVSPGYVPPGSVPPGYRVVTVPPGSPPPTTTPPVTPVTPVPTTSVPPRPVDTTAFAPRRIERRRIEPDTLAIDSVRMRENARLRDSLRTRDSVPRDSVRVRDTVPAIERKRCETQRAETIFVRSTGRIDTVVVKRPLAKCDTAGPP